MKNLFKIACIALMVSCSSEPPATSSNTNSGGSSVTCLSLAGANFDQIGTEDGKLVCLDNGCSGTCNYNDAVTTLGGKTYKLEKAFSVDNIAYYKADISLGNDSTPLNCTFNGEILLHDETTTQKKWNSDAAPCESMDLLVSCLNGQLEFETSDEFTFDQPCSDENGPCAGKDEGLVVDSNGNELSDDMKTMFVNSTVVDLTKPDVNDCNVEDNKSFPNGSFKCLGEDRAEEITTAAPTCKEVIGVTENGHDLVDLSAGEAKLNLLTELLKNNNAYSYHTEADLQVELSSVNHSGDEVDNTGITQSGNEVTIDIAMVEERVSEQRILTLYFKLENMEDKEDDAYRESKVAEINVKLAPKVDNNVDMIKKVTGLTLAKDKEMLKFKVNEGHQLNSKWENLRYELVADSLMSNDVKNSDNSMKAEYLVAQLVDDADMNHISLTRPENNDVLTYSKVEVQFKVYGVDKTDPDNTDESLIGENVAEVIVENKDCGDIEHGEKVDDSDKFFYSFKNSYANCDDMAQPAIVLCKNSREILSSQDDSIYKFSKCNSWDQDLSKFKIAESNSSALETLNVKDAKEGDSAVAISDLFSLVKVESDKTTVLADFYNQLNKMEVKLTRLATSWGTPGSVGISDYATIEKNGDKFQVKVNTLKLKEELGEDMTKSGAFNLELSISYENMDGDMVDLAEALEVKTGLRFTQE